MPPFFGPRNHPQNRKFPYNANLGLFSAILDTLCTILYVSDLFDNEKWRKYWNPNKFYW